MERLGFIRSMMDVKVLILCVMARVFYPLEEQEIYELCYQDDCLSYFDVREAIPQLEKSGHLAKTSEGKYEITQKGREDGATTEDSLPFSVMQRAIAAVDEFNKQTRRSQLIHTDIQPRDGGDFTVAMSLESELGNLMKLELMAPNLQQARKLAASYKANAEEVFGLVMKTLVDDFRR